jgi:hypothetical protein
VSRKRWACASGTPAKRNRRRRLLCQSPTHDFGLLSPVQKKYCASFEIGMALRASVTVEGNGHQTAVSVFAVYKKSLPFWIRSQRRVTASLIRRLAMFRAYQSSLPERERRFGLCSQCNSTNARDSSPAAESGSTLTGETRRFHSLTRMMSVSGCYDSCVSQRD